MKIIRAATLGRAHELVIAHILEKGRERLTENGEATLETDEIALRVENPFAEPMASEKSRFRRSFLDCYADDLIKGSDAVFEYDYHPASLTGARASPVQQGMERRKRARQSHIQRLMQPSTQTRYTIL